MLKRLSRKQVKVRSNLTGRNLDGRKTSKIARYDQSALPQTVYSTLAHRIVDFLEDGGDPNQVIDRIVDFGVHVSSPDKVAGGFAVIDGTAAAYLKVASFLGSQRETQVRAVMLEVGAVSLAYDEKLWSELAAHLSSIGQTESAANVYGFLSNAVPDNLHHAWNAATLMLVSQRRDQAMEFWQRAVAADKRQRNTSRRVDAFRPLFAFVNGDPINKSLRGSLRSRIDEMVELDEWMRRRAAQIIEANFPDCLFSTYSGADIETALSCLREMGFEANLLAGSARLDISQITDPDALRAMAMTAAAKGDHDKAIEIVNRLEDGAGANPQNWLRMACIYTAIGRFDDSLKALNSINASEADLKSVLESVPKGNPSEKVVPFLIELWGRSPNSTELARFTGEVAFENGALDVAIRAFKSINRDSLNDPSVDYKLGIASLMTNSVAEARAAFDAAIQHNPMHRDARFYRGHAAYQMADFDAAIEDFSVAARSGPDSAETLFFLGVAQRAARQHDGAATTARDGLEIVDRDSEFHDKLRFLYFTEAAISQDQGLRAGAIAYALETVKSGKLGFNQKLLCMIFLNNMRAYAEARDVCDMLLRQAPLSDIVQVWDAFINAKLGIIAKLPDIMAVEAPEPATDLVTRLLAAIHSRQFLSLGRWDEASKAAIPLVTMDPSFGGAAFTMGKALTMVGKASAAVPYLQRAQRCGRDLKEIQSLLRMANFATTKELDAGIENGDGADAQPLWENNGNLISPIVTIGVPCFNETRFLSDALNSVWFQSLPFWQCVVVDDVSSDSTRQLAKDYCRADPRFAVITHTENGGLAAARNTALSVAHTPYITFLDGDDMLTMSSLWRRGSILVKRFSDRYCAGVHGGIRHVPETDFCEFRLREPEIALKPVNFANSNFEAPFNAHAPLLRTVVMHEAGGFDADMRHGAEDWECWLRLLRRGYNFHPSPFLCGLYRQKRGSMVRSMAPQHVDAASRIYGSLFSKDESALMTFRDSYPVVDASVRFTKRSLRFATMAQLAGDTDGAARIIGRIPLSLEQIERSGIQIPQLVREGINRFYADTFNTIGGVSRKAMVESKVTQIADTFNEQLENRGDVQLTIDQDEMASQFNTDGKGTGEALSGGSSSGPAYVRLEEAGQRYATRDKIEAMRNKHAGERCFIIGNGPSLNNLDLRKIGNTPAIGVNGLFYKCEEVGWWPRYYTVEDSSVMKENLDRIVAFPAEQKFFPAIYNRLHPHDENVNFFVMNRGFYEAKSPNFGVPRFSTDFAQRAYCGQTVTYINMQLAFHLGFSEVYLIGMDFSYVIPKDFDKSGDMIVSTGDDPNHFHPDYFGKGKSWKDPKLEMVLLNYRMAKLAYEAAGRRIYNATVGGQLELFERVDYNSLFDA